MKFLLIFNKLFTTISLLLLLVNDSFEGFPDFYTVSKRDPKEDKLWPDIKVDAGYPSMFMPAVNVEKELSFDSIYDFVKAPRYYLNNDDDLNTEDNNEYAESNFNGFDNGNIVEEEHDNVNEQDNIKEDEVGVEVPKYTYRIRAKPSATSSSSSVQESLRPLKEEDSESSPLASNEDFQGLPNDFDTNNKNVPEIIPLSTSSASESSAPTTSATSVSSSATSVTTEEVQDSKFSEPKYSETLSSVDSTSSQSAKKTKDLPKVIRYYYKTVDGTT